MIPGRNFRLHSLRLLQKHKSHIPVEWIKRLEEITGFYLIVVINLADNTNSFRGEGLLDDLQ